MKKLSRKVLGVVSAAAMTLTSFAGASANSLTNPNILLTDKTVTGGSTYISTYLKADYFAKSAFKVTYQYLRLDADGKYYDKDEKVEKPIDYKDTFDFRVFDTSWGGWNPTAVGEADPEVGEVYTGTASIADIESKLKTGLGVQGINFETGNIGDTVVKVLSLEYVNANMEGASATFAGKGWTKGEGGMKDLAKTEGSGKITMTDWNIQISDICAYGFKNPTVDVTVKYDSVPSDFVQAEILAGVGDNAKPILSYYPKVTSTGTVTYTTEFNASLTAMTVCYDACTVQKIRIYDNTLGDKDVTVTGKTATEIAKDMGKAWNLGNALDAVTKEGKADENAWIEATTTKKLIQAVKGYDFVKEGEKAGEPVVENGEAVVTPRFNTVRIPVSFLDKITSDNKVDPDYLARVKQVVDYAYDMGMYVVIDMHNDGGHGIPTQWLDITKTGAQFTAIKAKFASVWSDIADYFKDYDQKLVFEGYNELMNGNYDSNPTIVQSNNVNALAQAFVDAVRGAGGKNAERVLIVAGYNTNIQQTISRFKKPTDTAYDRLMLSVHYYDPYDFALKEDSGVTTWGSDAEKTAMKTAIETIAEYGRYNDMPIFIGEYGPIDKDNTTVRKEYCKCLNDYAKNNGAGTTIVDAAYWDNGVIGINGSALFDRVDNSVTATGAQIILGIHGK